MLSAVILRHSDVGLLVGADELRFLDPSVGQLDFDFLHVGDDVMIGEDVAFARNDHAGADGKLLWLLRLRRPWGRGGVWRGRSRKFGRRSSNGSMSIGRCARWRELVMLTTGRDDRLDQSGVFGIEGSQHLDVLGVDARTFRRRVLLGALAPVQPVVELQPAVEVPNETRAAMRKMKSERRMNRGLTDL